jgi:hypothetical protein
MITETDRISEALDKAEALWPELEGDRAALLRKVIEAGVQGLEQESGQKKAMRLKQIEKVAGSMNDVWPSNWRKELRDEWPA